MSTNHPPKHDHPKMEFPRPGRDFTKSEVMTTMAYIKVYDQKQYKIGANTMDKAFKSVQITLKRLLLNGEQNAKEMLAELKSLGDAENMEKELQGRLIYKDACRLKLKFVKGLATLAAYVSEGIFYDFSDRTFHETESYKRPLLDDDAETSEPAAKVQRVSSDHPAANKHVNNGQMGNLPPPNRPRNPVPYNNRNPVMNFRPQMMNSRPQMMNTHPMRPMMMNRAPNMMNCPPRNAPPRMNVHPRFNPPRPQRMNQPPRMNQHLTPIPPPMKSEPVGVVDHKVPFVEKSPVVVINGIEEGLVNCDMMFNLLCQYGDVVKVMFLKEKKMMMVQMAAHEHAQAVSDHLNNYTLFGCKMAMMMSNKAYLYQKYSSVLADGTPSNKSYEGSELHRYCKPHLAKKCVRKRPSKTVMFYFAPTNFAFQKMREICFDAVVDQPKKFFPFPNSKNKPSSSGLLEFENVTQALECIAKCNHVELPQAAGGYSVKLRLCFAERCIPENA